MTRTPSPFAAWDAHRFASCLRCRSVGTVVDMGICCRVAALVELDAVSETFRPLPDNATVWRMRRVA